MESLNINYIISLNNVESICRICLQKEGSISLLATAVHNMVEINILQVFESCAGTQVEENDKLPQHICSNCFICLVKTNDFIMKCRKSNSLLEHLKSVWKQQADIKEEALTKTTEDNNKEPNKNHSEDKNAAVKLEVPTQTKDCLTFTPTCNIGNVKIICKVCGMLFESKCALKRHVHLHKLHPVKCEVCSKYFTNWSNLKRHSISHLEAKPHKCHICDKAFSRLATLKDHQNVHAGFKPYLCDICDKTFYRMSYLKVHLNKHKELCNDDTKLKCNICNSVLASRQALVNHMSTHVHNFLCSLCGAKFAQKGNLLHHYRSHTGERPFSCDECPKTFTYKQGLKIHKLMHAGVKPHPCKVCGRSFTQLNNLRRHMRYHEGTKPYACKYCDKRFVEKGNLTVHMRIHTGETPYTCSVCSEGFYDSSTFKKHKRKHEKLQTSENNKPT